VKLVVEAAAESSSQFPSVLVSTSGYWSLTVCPME
jgi:hypothetical protein